MSRRTGWGGRALGCAIALGVVLGLAGPASAATDIRGTWTVQVSLGGVTNNTQYWRIAGDAGAGSFTGDTGTTPTAGTFGTLTATLSGTSFQMTNPYTGGGYTATFAGTLSGTSSMSGTWTSNAAQSGTWTGTLTTPAPPAGPATPAPGTPAAGGTRPSAISILCNRGPQPTSPSQCTASVADAGPAPPKVPTGTVTWTAREGSVSSPTCTLQATSPSSPTVATCAVTYQPGPAGTPAGTPVPVGARYGGDADLAPSSTDHKLITPVCVGVPGRPCPGTVADAFGLQATLTVPQRQALEHLSLLLRCGGGQTAAQIGIAGPACNANALLSALFDDAEGDLARALDSVDLKNLESAYREALRVMSGDGPGADAPCVGTFRQGCSRMLKDLGISDSQIAGLAGQLTFADLHAMTDLLTEAYLTAGGASFDQRLAVVADKWRREREEREAICRGADPAGFTYRALRCGQIGFARRVHPPVRLARAGARLGLGATSKVSLRLTPGGRLVSALMRSAGVRTMRLRLTTTVAVQGRRTSARTVKVAIPLR